jgi:hypothetical protein
LGKFEVQHKLQALLYLFNEESGLQPYGLPENRPLTRLGKGGHGTGRVPHVRTSVRGPKKTGNPDFLHMAPNRFTCAAFIKESRMKFANANNLHRKSGEAHHSFGYTGNKCWVPHSSRTFACPGAPWGLSGIMAVDVPLPVCHVRPGELKISQ